MIPVSYATMGTGDGSENFTPLFVGGAPRTGTTVLHALLCTSEKTNPYIGECSYFSAFITPFIVGLKNFDVHTRHYFASREELAEHHTMVLRQELTKIWKRVGRPKVLVLKDPLLTSSFYHLAVLLKSAQFVVSVRDPRDTIASRIEVMRRTDKRFRLNYGHVEALCREYLHTYHSIIDNRAIFADRLCLVNYNDVVNGKAIPTLENLDIGSIHSDKIWTDAITNVKEYAHDEWATPLYGEKLSTLSINRHNNTLPPVIGAFIAKRCGSLAKEMGLPMEITQPLPSIFGQYYDRCTRRAFNIFSLCLHAGVTLGKNLLNKDAISQNNQVNTAV